VEVRTQSGTLVVLDCGTGAHGLGWSLLASGERAIRGHILITHTHWDHIQGFPFFQPLFQPNNEWDVYAPGGMGQQIEATLAGQMQYTYFPVTMEQLGATIRFHDLVEGTFSLGDVRVTAQYLNHPALTLGYRLEAGGVSLAYCLDHEPHSGRQLASALRSGTTPPLPRIHREEQRHIEFIRGADLVIHDSQYTFKEYPEKVGWGHTPAEWAVDYAVAAGARRLALCHFDPLRDDEDVDRLLDMCRGRLGRNDSALQVLAAAEGQEIDLPEKGLVESNHTHRSPGPSVTAGYAPRAATRTVLIVDDDPDTLRLLQKTLQPEGVRLLTASDGDAALYLARTERPDLLLLDWHLPGKDGIEVCSLLRAEQDLFFQEVPIVLITGRYDLTYAPAGFGAGATDFMVKPFAPAHIRSRVRAWLLRGGERS
jgi:CheY-like chemotaxis protein/phosphoribosyl 1,2-cyclic phosphodiesterase